MIRPPSVVFLRALLLATFLTGCAQNVKVITEPVPTPSFPPQLWMKSGDYRACLEENQKLLKECKDEDEECVSPLFNLGFVHAYSKSPYHNQAKALHYFEKLVEKYPENPLSFQATAWMDLMKRQVTFERSRRQMANELKSKHTELKSKDTELKSRDSELKSKDSELKTRETTIDSLQEGLKRSRELEMTINDLQEQLKRSREIDMEIDRKERQLLQ
jgi:hypothetical protein